MSPEDLARQRWKAVNKKVEERNQLVHKLNETNDRLVRLRDELPRAEQADREAFAAALAQDKAEPERRVEQITAGIEREQRRAEACALGIENAEQELRTLCKKNGLWRRETLRTIATARLDYEEGIRKLEAAREALAGEVALIGWLANGSQRRACQQQAPGLGRPAASVQPSADCASPGR